MSEQKNKSKSRIYISSEVREFEDFLKIAMNKGFGIEIQAFAFPEIMYGDWLRTLLYYKDLLYGFNNGIAFHNVFFSAVTVSEDYRVVETTKEKMRYGFMVANELKAKTVVAHFFWLPEYRENSFDFYLDGQLRFWDEFVNFAEKNEIMIVMENTLESRPDYIVPIIEKINSPYFQINWDIGHANLFTEVPLVNWISAFKNCLKYIHFHTNNGKYDQHIWNDKGTINFEPIFLRIAEYDLHPIFTTEIYKRSELEDALIFLETQLSKYNI